MELMNRNGNGKLIVEFFSEPREFFVTFFKIICTSHPSIVSLFLFYTLSLSPTLFFFFLFPDPTSAQFVDIRLYLDIGFNQEYPITILFGL